MWIRPYIDTNPHFFFFLDFPWIGWFSLKCGFLSIKQWIHISSVQAFIRFCIQSIWISYDLVIFLKNVDSSLYPHFKENNLGNVNKFRINGINRSVRITIQTLKTDVLGRIDQARNVPLPVQCRMTSQFFNRCLKFPPLQTASRKKTRPLYVLTSPYRLYFCQDTNSLILNGD